ncbi:hypothetical protein F5141DRAFT_286991 [Pisolithus sp. B1]|nr:hypothetical protein F5141DRAFT_286991 [Pisolithus sp. B1]
MILAVAGLCIVVGPTCNPKPYEPPRFHPIFWGIIATSGLLKGYGLSRVNPAATGLLHSPLDITMCFRLTQLTEFSCGHTSIARQQRVDCNRSSCSFSQAHNPNTHDCNAECAQRMLADQTIIMDTVSRPCTRCAGHTNGF